MPAKRKATAGMRDLGGFLTAAALPLPWVIAHALGGVGLQSEIVALLAGLAILGGAFILSWATELAERDIPQSLALLVLALVSVLPEYAVDLHFAIKAAEDPEYAHYAVANMTGANRLLIGLGWAAVALVACRRNRTTSLRIEPHHRVEIRFLLLATLYSFVVPFDGYINLFDAAILLGLFLWYAFSAAHGGFEKVELVGPAALVDREFGDFGRRLWALVLFVFAGYAIFISAQPFADSLVYVGRSRAIDEFILVQWVAPLASESPEFVIAILFATRMRGGMGLGALISSKVNQWTLLVGALPIAFCMASMSLRGLPLDARQTEELYLTSAQSLLATLLICNLEISRLEAVMLAALFGVQLVFPSPDVRVAFSVLYLAIFLGLLIHSPIRRRAFVDLLRTVPR
jgi:cation:H+ antiporter